MRYGIRIIHFEINLIVYIETINLHYYTPILDARILSLLKGFIENTLLSGVFVVERITGRLSSGKCSEGLIIGKLLATDPSFKILVTWVWPGTLVADLIVGRSLLAGRITAWLSSGECSEVLIKGKLLPTSPSSKMLFTWERPGTFVADLIVGRPLISQK